jgi:hypothetical protein
MNSTCAVCNAPLAPADRTEALPDGTMARHVDFMDCLKATFDRANEPSAVMRGFLGFGPTIEQEVADVIARAGERE